MWQSPSYRRPIATLPLAEHVLSSHEGQGSDGGGDGGLPFCPLQYKTRSEEKMERAVNSVFHNGLSIRKATEIYGVPKSTLGN